MDDTLSDAVQATALRAARRSWASASRATSTLPFDREDLEQESLLAGWLWIQQHGYGPSYDNELGRYLHSHLRYRLVDYMRSINPIGRRHPDGTYQHGGKSPLSLDADIGGRQGYTTFGDLLPDPAADDHFTKIEDREDIERAFRDWDGPPRHAEVAWLYAQGHRIKDIAEAYGVTESRACQIRSAFISSVAREWALPDGRADAA